MKRCIRFFTAGSIAMLLTLALTTSVFAQNGAHSALSTQVTFGIQVPWSNLYNATVQGDYVAAGIGMRNVGSGTINIAIPAGASITKAWMFWAVIWDDVQPANTGDLNGTTFNGTFIGTSGSPCWGGDGIDFFYADVSSAIQTGANALTNFPSGLTNGATPIGNAVFPLMEGATLVVEFTHPLWDFNVINIDVAAQTFANLTTTNNFGSYTATTAGNPADQTAQTTFVMADGQLRWANDATAFNGIPTSGPGTAVKTADAFDGADGIPVHPLDGLWDTHSLNVSSFFPNQVATNSNISATAGSGNDCISWGAQVISVKSGLHAFIDVKAGSCPNSVNINSKGVLPVSIVGTSWFDVTDVDPSTVQLNGIGAFGGTVIEDSATPYMDSAMDCYDCNADGDDGYDDLVLKFKMKDVVPTLGNPNDGDCVVVTVTGYLYDGTPFSGTDVLRIINNSSPKDGRGISGFDLTLEQNAPNPVVTATSFRYTLPSAANVRLEIFNALGQRVARVVDGNRAAGAHTATWDGLSSSGAPLTPGSYIYRLSAGDQVLSKMLIIAR